MMLNQAAGDRQYPGKAAQYFSPHQLSYVTHSGEGEGLLFYGNVITIPFVDRFPQDTELYKAMTTKLSEVAAEREKPMDRVDVGNAKSRELPEEKTEKGGTEVTPSKAPEVSER
jgi:hypothetical protein